MTTTKDFVVLDDRKVRLVGIPVVALIMHLISHDLEKASASIASFLEGWGIAFIFTFLYWQGNRWIWAQLAYRYPHYSQTRMRLILLFFSCLVYSLGVSIGGDYLVSALLGHECPFDSLVDSCLTGLVPTFLVLLIYESVFFFESWKANVKKTEALARENVQSQLETLKNQLDPHFLFNSLNTLAALIDENTPAQEYLDRLADVYRYVLVSREKNTVTLEEEMDFLDAYIYLNKVRFRENLQIEKELPANAYQQQVAPLSLQMLVENAIKHNIVSKEKPLKIRIAQVGDNYLAIENNMQEKVTFEKSTKVGLQNIRNRYRLLTDLPIEINTDENSFRVRIPLLQPS